jgi:hypothetical protein
MSSHFELFKQQIDDALSLIDQAKIVEEKQVAHAPSDIVDTHSLLERCEKVCHSYNSEKPIIRVVHHLACSGGTLISKCIASMPNVYLLSEVHPYTDLGVDFEKPRYSPTDIISLAKYAGIPHNKELSQEVFKKSVRTLYNHLEQFGGKLVLREHTHADFNTTAVIPNNATNLIQLLQDEYDVRSVITLRHPIDAYASLVRSGWVHFEPQSFDEYCHRLLRLINNFDLEKDEFFFYENFVQDSHSEMKKICSALEIEFNEMFEDIFGVFKVTGDSGRSSEYIGLRERNATDDLIKEAEESRSFQQLCERGFFVD